MRINFINETNQDAYLKFGPTLPVGTFNGTPITDINVSYNADPNSTLTGLDLTSYTGGKIYLSLGSPLASPYTDSGTGAYYPVPDFQYQSANTDWQIRWDKIELTLLSDPHAVSVANLTATDFFGLRIQLETYATPTATTPLQVLTTSASTADIFSAVAGIANNDPGQTNAAIVPGAAGLAVPGLGTILRVIAPSTVPAAAVNVYQSPQDYIDYVQGNTIVTHVTGQYSSATSTTPATTTQTYDFMAEIPDSGVNQGALVITGSGSVVGANQTIIVAQADLASGLVTQNPPYTVNGTAASFADNDVYAAVVRDMLGGFGFGFVGSTQINLNTGNQYVNDPTAAWYSPQLGLGVAYAAAQPTQPTFYSQYAAILAQDIGTNGTYVPLSDAYGFPFTDLLGAPLVDIGPATVDHIDITILADVEPGSVPCFATGTPIMTTQGEIPVERLTVGMEVATCLGGRSARIIWIGCRAVDCRRHRTPDAVNPVRVRRDAFGSGMPHRDIHLSPDHAVLFEDVLIPIRYLVNGVSVVQEAADIVTYWHVELDRHDVIQAAGLRAESFLDIGNRHAFANAGPVVMAHPTFHRLTWEAQGCAPLVVTGPQLLAVRTLLERDDIAFAQRSRSSSLFSRVIQTSGDSASGHRALAARAATISGGAEAEPAWMGWMRAPPRRSPGDGGTPAAACAAASLAGRTPHDRKASVAACDGPLASRTLRARGG